MREKLTPKEEMWESLIEEYPFPSIVPEQALLSDNEGSSKEVLSDSEGPSKEDVKPENSVMEVIA